MIFRPKPIASPLNGDAILFEVSSVTRLTAKAQVMLGICNTLLRQSRKLSKSWSFPCRYLLSDSLWSAQIWDETTKAQQETPGATVGFLRHRKKPSAPSVWGWCTCITPTVETLEICRASQSPTQTPGPHFNNLSSWIRARRPRHKERGKILIDPSKNTFHALRMGLHSWKRNRHQSPLE